MSSAGDPFFAKSSKSPHWTYERTTYYPWFTIIVSVFELIVLFLEFAQNGGIEKTLWANVNRSTLLSLGGMSAHFFGFTSPSDRSSPELQRSSGPTSSGDSGGGSSIPCFYISASCTSSSVRLPPLTHYRCTAADPSIDHILDIGLQILLGFQMEPMLGPWRMGVIYIVSGAHFAAHRNCVGLLIEDQASEATCLAPCSSPASSRLVLRLRSTVRCDTLRHSQSRRHTRAQIGTGSRTLTLAHSSNKGRISHANLVKVGSASTSPICSRTGSTTRTPARS